MSSPTAELSFAKATSSKDDDDDYSPMKNRSQKTTSKGPYRLKWYLGALEDSEGFLADNNINSRKEPPEFLALAPASTFVPTI